MTSAAIAHWTAKLSRDRLEKLWYVPVLAFAMVLMMARLFVMARLLGVSAFAEFSAGVLISGTFCMLGCLGLQSMLQREWPVNILRRQEFRGLVLATQCNLVATACAAIGMLFALLGFAPANLSGGLLATGLLHGLSQQMFLISTLDSRSRGEAMLFARQNLTRALGSVLFGSLVAVSTGRAIPTLAVEAIVSIAISLDLSRRSADRASAPLRNLFLLAIRRLPLSRWRSAVTLMAITAMSFVLLNADRWLATGALRLEAFAQYSFAWIVLIVAQSVQAIANASIYPLLARRSATSGRRNAFRVCVFVSAISLVAGSVCCIPVLILFPFAIERWFPMYVDAIALLPIFLVIGVLRASDFWSSFLLIARREALLLTVYVIVALGGGLLWWLAFRPWERSVDLRDIAWLALTLTLLSYLATGFLAWRSRKT